MYVLAFDYGHKRIGVAIGQTISKTATPLATLERQKGAVWSQVGQSEHIGSSCSRENGVEAICDCDSDVSCF